MASRRGEFVHVDILHQQRDVVDVLPRPLSLQHVDQGGRTHAQRDEQHLAAPPFLQPQHFETDLVPIPLDDRLDIGHGEHHVVDADNFHRPTSKQYAMEPVAGCSRSDPAGHGSVMPTCVTTARAPGVPHAAD